MVLFEKLKTEERRKVVLNFCAFNFEQFSMHVTKIKTLQLKPDQNEVTFCKRGKSTSQDMTAFQNSFLRKYWQIFFQICKLILSDLKRQKKVPHLQKTTSLVFVAKLLLDMSRFAQLLLGEGMSLVCNIF